MNITSKLKYIRNRMNTFDCRAYDIERTANESSSWWSSLTTFVSNYYKEMDYYIDLFQVGSAIQSGGGNRRMKK